MKGKILLVTGLAVGYVLGAKAGRERYESIKRVTDKFWNSRGVQAQVNNAEGFVKDKASDAVDLVADRVKKAASRATGSGIHKPSTARPAARTTSTSGPNASKK
jgi:hypothetical protein